MVRKTKLAQRRDFIRWVNSEDVTRLENYFELGRAELDYDGVVGWSTAKKTAEFVGILNGDSGEALDRAEQIMLDFKENCGYIASDDNHPGDIVIVFPGDAEVYVKVKIEFGSLYIGIHFHAQ